MVFLLMLICLTVATTTSAVPTAATVLMEGNEPGNHIVEGSTYVH